MPHPPDEIQDAFDGPWKEALRLFFPDAIGLLAPELFARIDWSRPIDFLDKELAQLQPEGPGGENVVDLLARVSDVSGAVGFVLIHAEVQADPDGRIPERMFRYRYRAFDLFGLPIESVLILADTHPRFRPDHFEQSGIVSRLRLDFLPVKLLDFEARWAELEASPNPFALFVMAHLKATRTRPDPERLYWKTWLVRQLYDRGYSREQVLELFWLVDWLLRLPPELKQSFRAELGRIEEERQMKYVTSIEEMGREEGLQQGLQQGAEKAALDALLEILDARFGPVGPDISKAVGRIHDLTVLRTLIRAAAVTDSLDSFARVLSAHASDTSTETPPTEP